MVATLTSPPSETMPIVQAIPMTGLRAGQTAVISALGMDPDDAKLLCAMGLCPRATIRMVRLGRPCVIAVGGVDSHRCKCGGRCRLGLAWDLASRILVTPVPITLPAPAELGAGAGSGRA